MTRVFQAVEHGAVSTTNGALDVSLQDQHSKIVNFFLLRTVQAATLVTQSSKDTPTFTVSSVSEPTNGNYLEIKEGDSVYQSTVLSHAPNSTNWDCVCALPPDKAFTVNATCRFGDVNINVDGSSAPAEYFLSMAGLDQGTEWDIVRVLAAKLDQTAMDDSTFGGIVALTKGVYLRVENEDPANLLIVRTNGDWKLEAFDVEYSSKAPAGFYGFNIRRTWGGQDHAGVVIRLRATEEDKISLYVQDDLTGLDSFSFKCQGSTVINSEPFE